MTCHLLMKIILTTYIVKHNNDNDDDANMGCCGVIGVILESTAVREMYRSKMS